MRQLDEFLASLIRMSEQTRSTYRGVIQRFYGIVGDVTPLKLNFGHVSKFINDMDVKQLSSNSVSLYLIVLKKYLKFIDRKDLAEKIKVPGRHAREIHHVNYKYWDDLIEAADPGRDRAIIATFLSTGMRCNECINIRVENIDWKEGTIKVKIKGGEWATYQMITSDIREYLKPFLAGRRHGFAFSGVYRTGHISGRLVRDIVKNAAVKAGIPNAHLIHPHSLRHSLAVYLKLEQRWDINVIQDVLHHKDIRTTSIYTKITDTEMTDFVKKHRPY